MNIKDNIEQIKVEVDFGKTVRSNNYPFEIIIELNEGEPVTIAFDLDNSPDLRGDAWVVHCETSMAQIIKELLLQDYTFILTILKSIVRQVIGDFIDRLGVKDKITPNGLALYYERIEYAIDNFARTLVPSEAIKHIAPDDNNFNTVS